MNLGTDVDDRFVTTYDTRWSTNFGANSSPTATLTCGTSARSATVSFYPLPAPPVAYPSSKLSAGIDPLPFSVPSVASFVADVHVTQGAVQVDAPSRQTVTSSATIPLGQLSPSNGSHELDIEKLDGPQAQYQVTIRPLPVAVSGTSAPAVAQATGASTVRYSVDGDTTVGFSVLDAAGVLRRAYAPFAVSAGDRSFTYDGTDGAGTPLPDGAYTLQIRSTDPYGGSSVQNVPISFDSSAPAVAVTQPATSTAVAAVTISDPAGLGDTNVTPSDTSSDVLEDSSGSSTQDRYTIKAPANGWSATNSVTVQAADRLGNTTSQSFKISVPAKASGPAGSASVGGKSTATPVKKGTASMKLATAHSRGVLVRGTSSRVGGQVTVRLTLAHSIAKKYRLPIVLGKTITHAAGNRTYSAKIKISKTAASRLRKRSKTTVSVKVTGGKALPNSVSLTR